MFDDILRKVHAVPLNDGRRIVAIVGAPASGKSTLAGQLCQDTPNSCVVPMDGFHRDNADLKYHGLLPRKGTPETFDAAAFVRLIQSLRCKAVVRFPTFDRVADRTVSGGGHVRASDDTVFVEGNYLLLDSTPWRELHHEWDFSVMLRVPLPVLRQRLVQRWLDHGFDTDAAAARANTNDIPNAELVTNHSLAADLVMSPVATADRFLNY